MFYNTLQRIMFNTESQNSKIYKIQVDFRHNAANFESESSFYELKIIILLRKQQVVGTASCNLFKIIL